MIDLDSLKSNKEWSFSDVKRSETLYATHGYHKYPAKFIPQLVRKLLQEYSNPGDLILDPFGGCGTTLVEAKLSGRKSLGIDVNRVAVLISRAKIRAISPRLLEGKNASLLGKISKAQDKRDHYAHAHPRLQYWFKRPQYNKLVSIYRKIQAESRNDVRTFYECCFSNILKNCSIWLAKSIKPQRDPQKIEEEPAITFTRHLRFMTQRNAECWNLLSASTFRENYCHAVKGDARRLPLPSEYADLVITSPPYVTSYEYAEIHQLSTLWFGFADDIRELRKDFIGTESRNRLTKALGEESTLAQDTVKRLSETSESTARHVSNYYADLLKCYREMYRVLKPSKRLCLILGNTEYLGIKIPNTEVSIEFLRELGFRIEKVIKRQLSAKIFTPFRDKDGRFTDAEHGSQRKIYQYEYLIVARKRK